MGEFEQLLESILPPTATILKLQNANNRPAILLADIDGDRLKELIVAYKYQGENFLLLLKKSYKMWCPIVEIKGKGHAITDLLAVPLTSQGGKSLVVGWQIGSIWSQLVLLQWKMYGFVNVLTKPVFYSKLFVEDMPGKRGKDGQFEIAIWIHDTGESYIVDVYRYNGKELQIAKDVYPYYFKKISFYYQQILQKYDFPYYWYYLADALVKAEEYNPALTAIDKALTFTNPYPSKEKMIDLKNQIVSKLRPN